MLHAEILHHFRHGKFEIGSRGDGQLLRFGGRQQRQSKPCKTSEPAKMGREFQGLFTIRGWNREVLSGCAETKSLKWLKIGRAAQSIENACWLDTLPERQ